MKKSHIDPPLNANPTTTEPSHATDNNAPPPDSYSSRHTSENEHQLSRSFTTNAEPSTADHLGPNDNITPHDLGTPTHISQNGHQTFRAFTTEADPTPADHFDPNDNVPPHSIGSPTHSSKQGHQSAATDTYRTMNTTKHQPRLQQHDTPNTTKRTNDSATTTPTPNKESYDNAKRRKPNAYQMNKESNSSNRMTKSKKSPHRQTATKTTHDTEADVDPEHRNIHQILPPPVYAATQGANDALTKRSKSVNPSIPADMNTKNGNKAHRQDSPRNTHCIPTRDSDADIPPSQNNDEGSTADTPGSTDHPLPDEPAASAPIMPQMMPSATTKTPATL